MTARLPNESIQGKLHVKESILKDLRDSSGREGGESRGGVDVRGRESA